MVKVPFVVKMSPYPHVNRLLRQADLCLGAFITQIIEVEWKDVELVDDKRVKKAAESLAEALESQHYEVTTVTRNGEVLATGKDFEINKNGLTFTGDGFEENQNG